MPQDSIYYYKTGEFRQFIQRIDNKNLTVLEALSTFRETKYLSNEFKQMTIQQLVDNPSLISELRSALRKVMEPESRFKLPYKKEEREQELITNLAENYKINVRKAKAKVITGHYKEPKTEREFNYALEVVIAPRSDIGVGHAGNIEIIGNVNSTPSIDGGERYFDGAYYWLDKKSKAISSTTLRGILQECGYNTSDYVSAAKKKVPSVLYVNLNTPCVDWLGGAGKTQINCEPYAKGIAQAVSSLAYKMPSYHGQGYGWSNESFGDKEKTARSYLEDFLIKRYNTIQSNPSLRLTDPLTQSGVWYRIRPIMIREGFLPPKDWGKTRKYITGLIDELCQELFENIEREDLGIFAKARGMMMYDERVYPVDMDSFEELGRKGVFILVIEKEGIARILEAPARNSGVAVVHTGGRFTKDVKKLIEHAQVPVATLTDYDTYGMEIANATFSTTPRIGIGEDIVEWLNQNGHPELRREDLEEEYVSKIWTDDEYLNKHRIELDSIAEKVGPELFWKYVKDKIEDLRKEKGFDYTKIITEPEPDEIYLPEIDNLILKLDDYIQKTVEGDWQEIDDELSKTKQLISIKEKEEENLKTLSDKVAKDKTMQNQIIPKIKKLLEELSDSLDDEGD